MKYSRKCQECGFRQYAKDPKSYKDTNSEKWRDVKCNKCHSTSLDYGTAVYEYDGNKWINTNDNGDLI